MPRKKLCVAWARIAEGRGTFIHESEFQYKLHGYDTPAVKVQLFVDPDGDYLGWIRERGSSTPDVPVMIQHKRIFPIQFPYGVDAAIRNGDGVSIPLSFEIIDED